MNDIAVQFWSHIIMVAAAAIGAGVAAILAVCWTLLGTYLRDNESPLVQANRELERRPRLGQPEQLP